MTSPLADLSYPSLAYDLVRYREDALDETLWQFVATSLEADDINAVRRQLDDDDLALLTTFARRRIVKAHRDHDVALLVQAFDTYAFLPTLAAGELVVWCNAGLFFGRDLGLDLEALLERFAAVALAPTVEQMTIAVASLDRLVSLDQCRLIETNTAHGVGLLNTVAVRETPAAMDDPIIGSTTTVASSMSEFTASYSPASHVANVAAALADAFENEEGHATTELRHDQLLAATFDLVTPGSLVPSRACVSFHVDSEVGPSFTVALADIDPALAGYRAEELADMADDLVDQAALAVGNLVALLTVVPDFDDMFGDHVWDESDEDEDDDDPLAVYLDLVRGVLESAN